MNVVQEVNVRKVLPVNLVLSKITNRERGIKKSLMLSTVDMLN